jgi:alpha-tubulin suppressor-like RCC1 family protein
LVTPITTVTGAWTSLAGGDRIACGACGAGCYQCWGVVAGVVTRLPTMPPDSPYDELFAGDNFACGVKAQTRYCWGENASGQLGDGTTIGPKTSPENLEAGIMHVAAAGLHGCALHTDGTIACWGSNAFGESARQVSAAVPSATDLGVSSCSAIAVASRYGCAICSGIPVCWGSNSNGELGRGTTSPSEVPAVVNVPTGLAFTQIVTGETRACALEQTGRLFCWGYGPRGELGTGAHATNLPTPLGQRR